jgi:sulfite reductase alpha subunit-like flavoprotein
VVVQRPRGAYNAGRLPYLARLSQNERLTPEDWNQETRHIELAIPGLAAGGPEQPYHYRAGDVAYVYPENEDEQVDVFLADMGLDGEAVLETGLNPARDDGQVRGAAAG